MLYPSAAKNINSNKMKENNTHTKRGGRGRCRGGRERGLEGKAERQREGEGGMGRDNNTEQPHPGHFLVSFLPSEEYKNGR